MKTKWDITFSLEIKLQLKYKICCLSPEVGGTDSSGAIVDLAWEIRILFAYKRCLCCSSFTLIVAKIINLDCFTCTPTDILTSHWWHFIKINLVHEQIQNLITNTTKKELSNLIQMFWSYARTYIFAIHFYSYC